ncbi:MAG: UDP-N-acetylglucosamine 1-carboxyvinyltransferase [Vampirovibrionales bacterium]|nr:UDP-N-acetylglucosamine 1-carboxyvinyltransferase [Vampirovibrionales bacterium]
MPDKLIVTGGRRLHGEIAVSGAKNSVLKLMAASLLTPQPVHLTNVPQLSDVNVMADVLRHLGCRVTQAGAEMWIQADSITCNEAPYELVSRMRASFNVLGPLLGRFGEARVSLPGGCSIGKRGIDLHVMGLQALGADVEIVHGYVEAKASQLRGSEIVLDIPSVGATENIMVSAVLADGATVIANAAQEPEIIDLANFLNTLGADVSGAGTSRIVIQGVSRASLRGGSYTVVPDRIEAMTYLMAAAGAQGDVTLHRVNPAHMQTEIYKLVEMGAEIETPTPNSVRILATRRLMAQNIVTLPYPGFPTDLQAPMMALLTIADGVGVIRETIYENRFRQVGNLKRMGAQIEQDGNVAIVTGAPFLSGAQVRASDLRAGAALVIAALHARGVSEIEGLEHLDRGYETLDAKLQALGADIARVTVEDDAASSQPMENRAV